MGMREKYQSLALADLKEIAKSRGIKGTSGMKKADIIDAMVALDEKEEKEQTAAPKAETKEETAEKPRTAHETKKSREKAAEEKKTEPVKSAAPVKAPAPSQPAAAEESHTASQNRNTDRRPVRRDTGIRKNGDSRPNGGQEQRSQRSIIVNNGNRQNTSGNQTGERPSYAERTDNTVRNENRNTPVERAEIAQAEIPAPAIAEDEKFPSDLDSGVTANGILEVMPDGYGFIRCANYLPGENDVYVAPSQIRRFNLKTGDIVVGNTRIKTQNEKFSALLYVKSINGYAMWRRRELILKI